MKTGVKVLLGIATLIQYIFVAIMILVGYLFITSVPSAEFEEYFSTYGLVLNLVFTFFSIYFPAISIIYIVHAARNVNLELSGMKTTWVVALVLVGGLVEPFYWYLHIWKDGKRVEKSGPLGLNDPHY